MAVAVNGVDVVVAAWANYVGGAAAVVAVAVAGVDVLVAASANYVGGVAVAVVVVVVTP